MQEKNKKRILILGCSTMQLPAIKAAKELDLFVIGADADSNACGVAVVDKFEHADISDKEKILKIATFYYNNGGLSAIFTAGTDFSQTVAFCCEKLNLPSLSYSASIKASNKFIMRETLNNAQCNVQKYSVFNEISKIDINNFSYPVVVKPIDNMGARGIKKVENKDDLIKSCSVAFKYSKSKQILIEDFLDGIEFSIDSLVEDDEIKISGVADRIIKFSPYFIEVGHTIPTQEKKEIVDTVIEEFKKGVKALGIKNGAAKGDVKYCKDNKAYIVEIAARLSGGYMSGWTYPYASNIDLTKCAIRLSLGENSLLPTIDKGFCSAERAFYSIPGIVSDILNIDKVKKDPFIKDVFLRTKIGDEVQFPKNNVEKCGNIISCALTASEAIQAAESAVRNVIVKLQPLNQQTIDYLIFNKSSQIIENSFKNIDFLSNFCFNIIKGEKKSSNLLIQFIKSPLLIERLENSVDWFGRKFNDGLDYLIENNYYTESENFDLVLDELFYRVYIRGSVQGAIWLAESLNEANRQGRLSEVLESWRKA